MNGEIKENDLVVLDGEGFENHLLYNKLSVVTKVSENRSSSNQLTIKYINNNNFQDTYYDTGCLKLFNPNEWNYKHKNNIFTNKVESIEHIYENGDIDYVIKFDDGRKRNLKECTLIKKETKPMKYKVITKLIVNFPENTIIEKHQNNNVYKSNNDPCVWLTTDLVENNPGFFEKLEFTEKNINTLNEQIIKLSIRFNAFGASEGFIKDFREFESIVKQMGELL